MLKISAHMPVSPIHTLSAARIRKDATTCSAVSVSAVSLVIKSIKDWKETIPVALGSTSIIMRANSTSPWNRREWRLTMTACMCDCMCENQTIAEFTNNTAASNQQWSALPSHIPWRWGRLWSHLFPLLHSSSTNQTPNFRKCCQRNTERTEYQTS